MGSGVAGALRRACWPQVEREAISKGPIKVGEAVATGAGKLATRGVKYIIHAAAMGAGAGASERSVREATLSSLRVAEQLAVKRIAFPALGAGVGGYEVRDCAKTMLGAVRDYATQNPNSAITEVIFVLWSDETFAAFSQMLNDEQPKV
jgi:O-acetyl-ADP-ribose deacetylase